jgi:hypothetical protein
MVVEQSDISLQRNTDYVRLYEIVTADAEGVETPVDLTGAALALDVKLRAGDADPPIASATITEDDYTLGRVTVALDGSQFDAVEGVNETVRLAYDFIATQDGNTYLLARGAIILAICLATRAGQSPIVLIRPYFLACSTPLAVPISPCGKTGFARAKCAPARYKPTRLTA